MTLKQIYLVEDDITTLDVDVIVNAANNGLLGGGGVDGAIHRAAGPDLLKQCRTMGGCATGDAKITRGYHLPARYVIHTVGPVWHGGHNREHKKLASCYQRSFDLIRQYHLKSAAFPAISTGVYGFPKEKAARIAVQQALQALADNPELETVIFTCFNQQTKQAYGKILNEVKNSTLKTI